MHATRLPVAVIGLLAGFALAVPTAGALGPACTPSAAWPAPRPDLAAGVVALINEHRTAMGLVPLQVTASLTASAEWKARDMAGRGYFTHDDPGPPTTRSPAERLAACGYADAGWGENIAVGYLTPTEVVAAWIASPDHRENIEDPAFRTTGVAAAGPQLYWAQEFGTKLDTPPTQLAASCAGRGHARVSCRVTARTGSAITLTLRRAGRTLARAGGLAGPGVLRLALRPARRLNAGTYRVVVRADTGAEVRVRRLVLTVG